MKIAVVNNFFPPRVGGSAHLSSSLATAYAAAGHDVRVLTAAFKNASSHEQRGGVHIVRLPAWTPPKLGTAIDFELSFALGPRNVRRIWRLLDEFEPDVIHLHGQFFDLTWMTGWWARRRRVPTLLSVHTRLESPHRAYDALFRMIDRLVVRPMLAIAQPKFVVMDRLMDRYIDHRYGTCNGKVPIPVGVEPSEARRAQQPATTRGLHGLEGRRVILSLGHVIPLRDRISLVRSLPAVLAAHPNAHVVVVGDVLYPRFLEEARSLGVAEHITCVGPVPKGAVADFLDIAEVEAHDLQGYGLGTASLEAMAAGVPVVAAVSGDNFAGIRLVSGENIMLVEPNDPASLADAICHLLDDTDDAKRIGASQQALIDQSFSMSAVAAEHLEVLGHLVRARRLNPKPGPQLTR